MKPGGAKQKGKNYEREIARLLSKAFDTQVKRVPCSGAIADLPGDLRNLSGPLEEWVFELKRQEHLSIWKAISQAQREAKGGKKWCLIFSRNHEGNDYVCIDLQDFIELIQKGKK